MPWGKTIYLYPMHGVYNAIYPYVNRVDNERYADICNIIPGPFEGGMLKFSFTTKRDGIDWFWKRDHSGVRRVAVLNEL